MSIVCVYSILFLQLMNLGLFPLFAFVHGCTMIIWLVDQLLLTFVYDENYRNCFHSQVKTFQSQEFLHSSHLMESVDLRGLSKMRVRGALGFGHW